MGSPDKSREALVRELEELEREVERLRSSAARPRVEDSLRESENLYRSLLESVADLVFSLDVSGKYLHVNHALAATLGKTVEEFVGKRISDTFPPEVAERFEANVRAVLASGKRLTIAEEPSITPAGERTISTTLSPVEDANGRIWALVGAVTDITDRKRAEEERKRLEEQVMRAQKLESLSVMAAGIAHDFNNILVSIIGNASLLSRVLEADDPNQRYVDAIQGAAKQASDLARQMLDYAGRGQSVRRHIDLNTLVRETAEMLRVSLQERTALTCDLTDESPALQGDESQIRQVVMNLVINAAEAIDGSPGEIAVRTRCVDGSVRAAVERYQFGSPPTGLCASLEVTDTGCGMDETTATRIFDPFFTTKLTGRGLGLAAAAGIVRGHYGAISVRSQPGRGTTFTILFPAITDAPAKPSAAGSTGPSASLSEKCVLIVDDDESVRTVGAQMAEQLGMKAVLAESGERALEILAQSADSIDVVLLDLMMPRLSGAETLARLRIRFPDLPVVLSSGLEGRAAATEADPAGVSGFLDKPYLLEELEAALTNALDRTHDDASGRD